MKNPSSKKNDVTASLLLAALVESSDDAIISKDLTGTITSWNKAAERIFGYSAAEVIGGPISIIIPPDKGAEELDILQRIRRGERLEHYETVRVRKDGKRMDVSVTISPLVKDGEIIGASKIARDVSQQKQLERDLQQQRAYLEVTLSSIGDGVILTDMNGAVTFMNGVAEALTGWKIDEARGQPIEAVFNIRNEKTRQRVENPVARALREGTIVGLANHTMLIRKDGVEHAIDDSAAPIRGNGETHGVVMVFRDVTGHRAAEDYRARLAAIVQSSDDAILSKDLTGRITSWNDAAAKLYGYSADEVVGRPISILIPADRLAEEAEILEQIRRGERVDHFETVRLTKDRRKVHVSLSISPLLDNEGNVVGASKIARDITERKRTERELVEARERLKKHSEELEKTVAERTADLNTAYQELETFTYTVAHDLRSPIRRMRGFLSILKDELRSGSQAAQEDMADKADAVAERMDHLIEDLLKLSKVSEQDLQRTPTALDSLLRTALAELKPQTEGRQVEWKIGSLPVVACDPSLMQQALINLVGNALKFTRSRSVAVIEIGQTDINGRTAFYVRDNGIGFRKEQAGKLFTPFHRLHPEREFEGTGIGLATVDRIIRKHGGRVWAEGEADQGATFYFTIAQ